MWIKVNTQDINNSKECPITLALRREFGKKISATRSFIRVATKHKGMRVVKLFKLASNAQDFMLSYDYNKDTDPFRFWIADKVVKQIRAL